MWYLLQLQCCSLLVVCCTWLVGEVERNRVVALAFHILMVGTVEEVVHHTRVVASSITVVVGVALHKDCAWVVPDG